MKYIKTFEKVSLDNYKVGDQIVLVRPTKFDLTRGFKKGGIYTITAIEPFNKKYPIELHFRIDGFINDLNFGLHQIRKAKPEEIIANQYNL